MRVLVIGGNGQLGTDLRAVWGPNCVGVDWPEFDVTRAAQVDAVLAEHRPGVVINCAARTNVDECEDEPETAFAVNALGALHVARAAGAAGALLVYVSTDYVFGADAQRRAPYTEDDRPGPLNVYGASKLAGEHLSEAYGGRTLVVRTCGLYGHAGARGKGGNFVETMLRLGREGRPVRVVNDQRLSPTSTVECAAKIAELVRCGATGLYHVAAADSCTWCEFAGAIFELAGLPVRPAAISSAEYPVRARRPAMSALSSRRLAGAGVSPCRPWRAMLADYLVTRPARRAPDAQVAGA